MLDLKPLLETEGANGKLERNNWGIRYVSDSKNILLQAIMVLTWLFSIITKPLLACCIPAPLSSRPVISA